MPKSSEIRHRIKQLDELRKIVDTMRSLAGVRVQQAHAALPAIRSYTASIDRTVVEAHPLLPAPAPGPPRRRSATGVVAFCSEHGFVGLHNERLLDEVERVGDPAGRTLLLVGSRGAANASERDLPLAWTTPMATHVEAVVEVALRVADEVYRRVGRGEFQRLVLVYAQSSPGAQEQVRVEQVLPFDLTPYRTTEMLVRPLHYLPAGELLEKLIDELLFAALMRAAMESFARENDARLATMSSAHDNVTKKIGALEQTERETRQEEITLELLDVITGAQAAEPDRR